MEKRISKGVLSAALILVTSFVCGIMLSQDFCLEIFKPFYILRFLKCAVCL